MPKRAGAAKGSGFKGNPMNVPKSSVRAARNKERAARRKAKNETGNTDSLKRAVFWLYMWQSMRLGLFLTGVSAAVSGAWRLYAVYA